MEHIEKERNGILISCSHADRRWIDELKENLSARVHGQGWRWLDTPPVESELGEEALKRDLGEARVAILLVTARYLSSDVVAGVVIPAVTAELKAGKLAAIWIPVSASQYEVTPLNNLPAAIPPGRPLDLATPAKRSDAWNQVWEAIATAAGVPSGAATSPPRVVVVYKRWVQTDELVMRGLHDDLTKRGCQVFLDRDLQAGIAWGKRIAEEIQCADVVIPLLSDASIRSEMMAYEVRLASDTAQVRNGKPKLLPVRVQYRGALPDSLDLLNPIQHVHWESPDDSPRLFREIAEAMSRPIEDCTASAPLGGSVPIGSDLYIEREADGELQRAIERGETLILVKGARQMGRTSLLARGLTAPTKHTRVAYTDFQRFNLSQLATLEGMYRGLMESLEESLDSGPESSLVWRPEKSPNWNLEKFLKRKVLAAPGRLVWGMDEVDRLFSFPYATEFFGLIRSWHNSRIIMGGVWENLSIVIAYATEPFLFIQDLNQSPFNVGFKIAVQDFTIDQLILLNDRAGSPLKSRADAEKFYELLGGHPLLAQRGLHELRHMSLKKLLETASRDDGPFGDHLRRMLVLLAADPDLMPAVERVLRGAGTFTSDQYFRLLRAGIFVGDSPQKAQPRCRLYQEYLERHLIQNRPALALAREI